MGIIDDVLASKDLADLAPVNNKPVDVPKKWTTEKVEQAISMLIAQRGNNQVAIARTVGMSAVQIDDLWQRVNARIAELQPTEKEIDVLEMSR